MNLGGNGYDLLERQNPSTLAVTTANKEPWELHSSQIVTENGSAQSNALVRVSIAVAIRHDQKQLVKKRVYLAYTYWAGYFYINLT